MVPTKSKAPIIASTDAAGTAPMALSPQSEMKCVCTSPLVLRPQMKKVPARIQKVRLDDASRSTRNGVRQFIVTAAVTGMAAACSALWPYGSKPRSDGRLRTKANASSAITMAPKNTGTTAERQPQCSIIQAATGKNASCPVAELAASAPITSPRRPTNQRFATTAPSTSAVRPVPMPSIRLQTMNSCHNCEASVTSAMPEPTSASPVHITARSP